MVFQPIRARAAFKLYYKQTVRATPSRIILLFRFSFYVLEELCIHKNYLVRDWQARAGACANKSSMQRGLLRITIEGKWTGVLANYVYLSPSS